MFTDEQIKKYTKYFEIASAIAAIIGVTMAVFEYSEKMRNLALMNNKAILDTQLVQLQIKKLQSENG